MKRVKAAIVLVGLSLAAAFAWVFFPATVEATHETFHPLTPAAFSVIRGDAIALESSLVPKGIRLAAGDRASQSIQFSCRGMPVLTLINEEMALSVLTYVGADQRAPEIANFRKQLYFRLERSGTPLEGNVLPHPPSAIEAFVLAYRDGIDTGSDCSRN